MATTRMAPQIKSDYDHIFFQALAALMVVVVFVGFAQTFYLSGVLQVPRWKAFAAPPHAWVVNVHGAISLRGRSCSWRKPLSPKPVASIYIAGWGWWGSPWPAWWF